MSAIPLLRRRRERRSNAHQRSQGLLTRGIIAIGSALVVLSGLLTIAGAFWYASITAELPSLEVLPGLLNPKNGSLLQPTRIYDRTGLHLLTTLAPQDEPRRYIPINPDAVEHLPNTLLRATVGLVDPDFWTHPGFRLDDFPDPERHSTLTQKLVSDLLLWNEPPSLRRAIRERILSAQLTSRFGREKILEWYLNSADYGHYAYGAESASRLYFGKPAAELNLAEAALLAAVNQSPAINPLDAPQAALQRELDALMLIQSRGLATSDEADQARVTPVIFLPASQPPFNIAPTFTALAISQLENRFNGVRAERGGMYILTTLDFELQRDADCSVQTQLARLSGSSPQPCDGSSALPPLPPGQNMPDAAASAVVLDPRSGQVLALIGDSKNGNRSAFLTPRQPGTLLTPFVYLTGFTRGLSPSSLVWDIPPANTVNDLGDITYQGPMRLRTAMVNDRMVPAQRLYTQMGAALVQQTMVPFGLDIYAASLEALLGTENRYSVIQIAQAFGVFAAQGTLSGQAYSDGLMPSAILTVQDFDEHIYADWSRSASEQVVSAQLAYLMTDALSADLPILGRPVTFKPGLPHGGGGAWATGYTPQRVVVVWMGGDEVSERPAAGLWTAIVQLASRNLPTEDWVQPAGMLRLKVCEPSGLLPADACPNVVDEIFIEGYQPVQVDTLYRSFAINRETNYLATIFTPQHLVENRVFMVVPPEAQAWANAIGLPAPPTQYDTVQPPVPNQDVNISSPDMFAELGGKVNINGTALGDGFSYYRLQFGQGMNPEKWVLIGSNNNRPVNNGKLAEWDTAGLDGLYSLQLIIVRTDNSLETANVLVTVNNR